MFQFPRCPLRDRSQSARPCAGRVAPFGDPRISGCQRLPGAFRRVAASFLGRQRQGIHHAPILRIPASIFHPASVATTPSDRHAPAGRRPAGAVPVPRAGPRRCCVCVMCLCSARGRPPTSPAPAPSWGDADLGVCASPTRASPSPAAAEPVGFRVAHCQGTVVRFLPPTGERERSPWRGLPLLEVVKPRPKPSADLGRSLPTIWRSA
jgi:hypothetical protein